MRQAECGIKEFFIILAVLSMTIPFIVLYSETLTRAFLVPESLTSDWELTLGTPTRRNITTSFTPLEPWTLQLTCVPPVDGFKAWKSGLVTVLEPEIPRDCERLFHSDSEEIGRVKKASKTWENKMSDDDFLTKTKNCSWLRNEFTDNLYNTFLERNFPLAFNFVIHKYPQQVFRLIKLLYRPQNVFCIHYDLRSNDSFKQIFDNTAKCFGNIIIASKIIKAEWAKYTLMEAQMNCFSDLVNWRSRLPIHQQWKYVLNLCGTELPLLTNHGIVMHLMSLNGTSSIKPGKVLKNTSSWQRIHGRPLPYNITYYKNSAYNALSYDFIAFLLENPIGIKVHDFFRKADNPEEHVYGSLYMHLGVPGGFREELSDKYVNIAMAFWCYSRERRRACHGKVVRNVCICASGDLPAIMSNANSSHNYFHNKYIMDMDHTVMDCLEERIVRRNQEEYEKDCGNSLQSNHT